jgi:hypothetical protein
MTSFVSFNFLLQILILFTFSVLPSIGSNLSYAKGTVPFKHSIHDFKQKIKATKSLMAYYIRQKSDWKYESNCLSLALLTFVQTALSNLN